MTCFRFIAAEKASFPISLLCRVLRVARSGFHAWRRRPPSEGVLADASVTERIRQIHKHSGRTYGSPRAHVELRCQGIRVGRKRVERLPRATGVSAVLTRKGRTTIRVRARGSPATWSGATSVRTGRTGSGAPI